MNQDDCFQLGYVIKPHGLKGEIDIFIDSDFPESYKEMESVFVNFHGNLVPFFIERSRLNGSRATIKLKTIDSIDKAKDLKSCTLHLPLGLLPQLDGNKFYFHEVTGFEVVDKKHGVIGKIEKFYDYPSQDFMAIIYNGKEVLIPVNTDIIDEVIRDKKQIKVNLPEGLLEIY